MADESNEMGAGDAGEEEVLDTLLPGSDDEDNDFIDEDDDAAERKKRASQRRSGDKGGGGRGGGADEAETSNLTDKEELGAAGFVLRFLPVSHNSRKDDCPSVRR